MPLYVVFYKYFRHVFRTCRSDRQVGFICRDFGFLSTYAAIAESLCDLLSCQVKACQKCCEQLFVSFVLDI